MTYYIDGLPLSTSAYIGTTVDLRPEGRQIMVNCHPFDTKLLRKNDDIYITGVLAAPLFLPWQLAYIRAFTYAFPSITIQSPVDPIFFTPEAYMFAKGYTDEHGS